MRGDSGAGETLGAPRTELCSDTHLQQALCGLGHVCQKHPSDEHKRQLIVQPGVVTRRDFQQKSTSVSRCCRASRLNYSEIRPSYASRGLFSCFHRAVLRPADKFNLLLLACLLLYLLASLYRSINKNIFTYRANGRAKVSWRWTFNIHLPLVCGRLVLLLNF